MVIQGCNILESKDLIQYSFGTNTFYIDGLIFAYGKKSGRETVEWMNGYFEEKCNFPFNELRGAFTCFVKTPKTVYAFTDNSNMHSLYLSNDIISNSFLSVVNTYKRSGRELHFDLQSICEYLTIGKICFEKTFFEQIKMLPIDSYLEIKQDSYRMVSKETGDIDSKSTLLNMSDFFDKLAYSLSDNKICQALTGGYDSRLIYACMTNRTDDHPAISANIDNNLDVVCAKKVAGLLTESLEIVRTEKPEYSDALIKKIVFDSDGMQPLDIDTWIRLRNFKKVLATRYNVHLTGDGGVLHKDWEWMQELPFYNKKKSDAKKFYRQRLAFIKSNLVGESLQDLFSDQESRFVDELKKISRESNTKSIDSWYYYVSGNRQVYYNVNPVDGIITYAPLNEIDLVRYSYNLPRSKRFFYNQIRQVTTMENKRIARVRTSYGTTASSERLFILKDIIIQCVDYSKKCLRMMSRTVFGKNIFVSSVLNWSMKEELMNSKLIDDALQFTKKSGFVNSGISKEKLSYAELQRIAHIYLLSNNSVS